MSTISSTQNTIHPTLLYGEKPKMHWLRPACCFVEAMSGQIECLSYQMRLSIEMLEGQLEEAGNPHVLQLALTGGDDRTPQAWELYADGVQVAHGDALFATQCFQESKTAFMDACKTAVIAADVDTLSNSDYKLLKIAKNIASINTINLDFC